VGATEISGTIRKLAQLSLDVIHLWLAIPDCFLLAGFVIISNFAKPHNCFRMAVDQLSECKVSPVIPRYTGVFLQRPRRRAFPDGASLIYQIIFKLDFSSEAAFLAPITLY